MAFRYFPKHHSRIHYQLESWKEKIRERLNIVSFSTNPLRKKKYGLGRIGAGCPEEIKFQDNLLGDFSKQFLLVHQISELL